MRRPTACSVGWFISLLVREEVPLTGLCERKILFRLEIYDRIRTGCKIGQLARFGWLTQRGKREIRACSQTHQPAPALCVRIMVACMSACACALLPPDRCCCCCMAIYLDYQSSGRLRIMLNLNMPRPPTNTKLGPLGPAPIPFPSSLLHCSCSHLPFRSSSASPALQTLRHRKIHDHAFLMKH